MANANRANARLKATLDGFHSPITRSVENPSFFDNSFNSHLFLQVNIDLAFRSRGGPGTGAMGEGKFELGGFQLDRLQLGKFQLGGSNSTIRTRPIPTRRFELDSSNSAVRTRRFELGGSNSTVRTRRFDLGGSNSAIRTRRFELDGWILAVVDHGTTVHFALDELGKRYLGLQDKGLGFKNKGRMMGQDWPVAVWK